MYVWVRVRVLFFLRKEEKIIIKGKYNMRINNDRF